MRYEDASGAFQASGPIANDDSDTLSAGQKGPATGNLITGEGTQYGAAGADIAAGAHITAIAGKGGEDSSFSGGKLSIAGEHGRLTVDADGNYSYLATGNVENVRDRFTYTLADNAGNSDTAALIVEIGKTPAVIKANAQQIVPGPDGVVTLPPGVELSDVHVVGRNLVVDLPDGTQLIIIDGAIFVPQLALDGVEVPATNVAALLIGQEVQPAAGEIPPSGGGNFALPPPPLDPGIPLGDLIPPTELFYIPPEPQEVLDVLDRDPEIFIEPDGQPASVAAVDQVEEAGLPARNGNLPNEPAGSGESADGNGADNDVTSETTAGTILINSPDGIASVTINNMLVTGAIGQTIPGAFGTLTITGFSGDDIFYSYTLSDNTSGNDTHDDFSVVLTDPDGDVASATLRIDIIDDVPTARPDTDTIPAGQFGPATGNVITDASAGDVGDSDSGADTVGADNASITAVSSANVPANSDNSSPFVVNGQYGVLTLQADGSYSYVRNQGTPGGVNDVFNYTLTDGDGDTSSTTLTISIGDATPQTGENPLVRFDDDALPGGNPGTPAVGDDTPDTVNASGTLAGSGGDGPITFAVQTTGAPSGFSYVSGGAGVVLIQQNGHTVLTVTVGSNGSYSVVQNAPIDHAAAGQENNQVFTINYTVTDQDGDSAPGTFTINVDDDTPTMSLADQGEPQLTVDETDLSVNASASFAANFSVSFGADGPAAASSLVYSLGINAGATGLIDVATGQPIVLVLNGGVVEGRVGDAAGAIAFTVSVNSANGTVTLDQIRALQHPNPADPDDSVTLANDNLVTLIATATDHDADVAAQTLNIGQNLNFEDDGPSVSPSQVEPQLIVDESNLTINDTRNFGDVFNEAFGADGPADSNSISFALGINAGATGLVDTLSGENVILVLNAGVVEGRTEFGNELVFTVSVNPNGDVVVDQLRAVVHPDPTNPDDSISLANDNLITLTATVADRDGDTASATINIGNNVSLEDDGPSISLSGTEPSLTVDETILATNASASFAGAFAPVFGADGPGSPGVTYALSINAGATGLIDVATGQAIVLVNNAGVIEGHVGSAIGALAFTVSVNAAGTVTLDQIRALQHPNPANPDDSVTLASDNLIVLTATVTDGDGDQASVPLNIGQNLNFEDDGPSINANGEQPSLTVDETVLANNASASFAGVFASAFGADGAGSIGYALGISAPGVASGLTDVATGQPVVLVLNGGVVEGHVGSPAGAIAFTVSIDANSGVVTLDQQRALTHPNAANPDDSVTLSADSLVTITATITDRDGDQQSATANIGQNLNFEDDGPTIQLSGTQPNLTVDETLILVDASANFGSAFTSAFGADGAGTVGYALSILSAGAASGLVDTLSGQPIILVMSLDGTFVEGRVGNALGAVAFTVTVDASGNVTLDQQRAVVHPNTLNPDDSITLSADNLVQLTATITDRDSDSQSATLNIGQNLNFEDDGPAAANDSDTIPSGGTSATGNVITGAGTDGGAAGADSSGADAPARITAIQGTGGTDTTFSGGLLEIGGAHGTLQIDANGNYTYTRTDNLPGTLQDVFTYTLTDADGDSVIATLTINMSDNAPNPPAAVTVLLDDDALAGGNAAGPGDRSPDTDNTTGNLVATGGDGDLDYFISASQSLPTGFTSVLNSVAGVQTLSISQNGTLVITVTLVNESGAYTVTQNAPIVHALDGNTEGEIPVGNVLSAINVSVFAQDADNDQSPPGTISISVDDDTPTVSAPGAQPSLTVDETVLATNASADFSGVFTHSFGADGAALANSIVYTLGINAGATGLIDVATGDPIVLVNNAGVIEGHVLNAGGPIAFTVSVNGTGTVTLDQVRALSHPNTANPDDSVTLASDNLITLTQTVTDRDGDQASATANIGQNLNFEDDGPSAAIVTTGQAVSIDESAGVQVDSNDTTAPAVIALFAGVANIGTDPNMAAQYAQNPSAIVASTGSAFGADGAGTIAFSLNVSAPGVDSGLDTTSGQSILLFKEGNLVVGRVSGGVDDGDAAFALAIDPTTGVVSMVEYLSIQHPNAADPDDSVPIANGALLATVTATDRDGDTSSQSTPIGSLISFQDAAPIMTAASNINIQNSGDVAHQGVFAFNLGADGAATNNNVLSVTGSATVNGAAVTNYSLVEQSENATTAVYSLSFDYPTGGGSTAHATGTVTFDKANGTYTVDMDAAIQGISIVQTATGTDFTGYDLNTSNETGSQPDVAVTQLRGDPNNPQPSDLFIQFTSIAEPGSGTGANNLETTQGAAGAFNPVTSSNFGNLELFTQEAGWVSASGSENGVNGDTVGQGEVLDFNLYQGTNPTGFVGNEPTATATTMFLKFDGITNDADNSGNGEDLIVILKLYDPVADSYTTKALIVQNTDIQKGPGAGPGVFSGVTLDNNDGLIVIEPNDYQEGNANLVIVGAQIVDSDEGVTGNGINFNNATGGGGASTGTEAFSTDNNDGPLKITSIGFLTTSTTDQDAELTFNVTVTDGDGDSITQTIVADITSDPDSSTPIVLAPAVTTVSQAPLGSKGTASVAESYQPSQYNAANSNVGNTGITSAMVAASGIAMMSTTSLTSFGEPSFDSLAQQGFQSLSTQVAGGEGMDDGLASMTFGSELGYSAADTVNLSGSIRSFDDDGFGGRGLDAMSFGNAEPAYVPNYASGEPTVANIPAFAANVPSVSMASAEMLKAVSLEGNVQHGGAVEQVLADALGNEAPTLDGVLANLPGGIAELAAIANLASPDGAGVPAWDMMGHGAFAPAPDMVFKVDAGMFHQDAVQPA